MSTRPWADNLSSEEKTQVGLCGLGVLAGALLCTVAPQIGLPIAITSAAGFFKGGYDSASKGEDVFEGGVRGAIAGAVTGAAGAAVPAAAHPIAHVAATTAAGTAASVINGTDPVGGAITGAASGLVGTVGQLSSTSSGSNTPSNQK